MAVTLRFQLTRNTAARNLRGLARRLPRVVDQQLERAGSRMFAGVQRGVRRRSGVLARSYRLATGRGFAIVGSELNRARFSEFGTGRGVTGSFVVHESLEAAAAGFERGLTRALQRAV